MEEEYKKVLRDLGFYYNREAGAMVREHGSIKYIWVEVTDGELMLYGHNMDLEEYDDNNDVVLLTDDEGEPTPVSLIGLEGERLAEELRGALERASSEIDHAF